MTAQLSREKLKQQLIECSQNDSGMFEVGEDTMCAMMALLAGMDSEPVAWWTGPEPTPTGEIESIHDHETGSHSIPLFAGYTAPPAPVAVLDALEQFALFMAEEAIKSGEDQSGWRGKASNAAHEYAQACRAAMLNPGTLINEVTTQDEHVTAATALDGAKEALSEAVAAIYFTDSSDYLSALFAVVKALSPETLELLLSNSKAAYEATRIAAAPAAPEQEV